MTNLNDIMELVGFTNTSIVVCDERGLVLRISNLFESTLNDLYRLKLQEMISLDMLNGYRNFTDFKNQLSDRPTHYTSTKIKANHTSKIDICVKKIKLLDGTRIILFAANEDVGARRNKNRDTMELAKIVKATSSAGIGTWEYIPEKKLAFFSPKMKELLGVSQEDFFDWNKFKSLIIEKDQGIFEEFFNNHVNLGSPLNFEFRVKISNRIRWFSIKGELFKSAITGSTVVGSIEDCTHQKKVLMQLSNASEARKLALEAGHIGTWKGVERGCGRWSWDWDVMTEQIFQFEDRELVKAGKWKERIHPEDVGLIVDTIKTVILTECSFELDFRICLPNEPERYIHAKGTVIKSINNDNRKIYGVCIDQTQTIKYRDELKKLNTELESRVAQRTKELQRVSVKASQANKAKSDFLAMMSHELRTPMNAIIGNLELVTNEELKQETRSLIETSKVAADSLVAILNDILDINKIESGKFELEETTFSISDVIDNITKIFLPVASKKNVIIDVREAVDIPNMVLGDEIRVRQILFNLLGNAIKFTSTNKERVGKVVIDVYIEDVDCDFQNVIFSIKDNGVGINKKVQSSLFAPFVQAEKSTTRKYGGTGLGLAICSKLAGMMGGKISMVSEYKVGSTFSLNLPVRKAKVIDSEHRKLTNLKVGIVNLNNYLEKVSIRYSSYLRAEGAIVELCEISNNKLSLNDNQQSFDLILLMVGELHFGTKFIEHAKKCSWFDKLVVAIDHTERNEFISKYPLIHNLPIKPLTRNQLISSLVDSMNTSKATTHSVELKGNEPFDINRQSCDEKTMNSCPDILIVEDNEFNQNLINKQMSRLGFKVDLADNGKQAIEKWSDNKYRLIFSDCHMPEMDGYEMTLKIRELEKSLMVKPIPIIAITGAAMSGDKEHCLSVGMNDFLSKPIKLNDLKYILEKWYVA
mgnify:CR=1 FL=1